jgi:hypothetical protein
MAPRWTSSAEVLRAACRRAIEDVDFRQVFADDEAIDERWPA